MGRVLLASSRYRPESLLNILEHTGQPPHSKTYPAPKISSPEAEKLIGVIRHSHGNRLFMVFCSKVKIPLTKHWVKITV